ncbi:MAG: hypothetical protein JSS89_13355 [Bacteroidetes bacterium]|nr:hypothetical protein [Bacteroidota bacterium]
MIALRKSTTKLTPLTFDSGVSSTNQRIVDPLISMPPVAKYLRSSGRTLRARGYQHQLGKYYTYTIVIGADALLEDGSLATFIEEFLSAPYRYISTPSGEDYIEVLHDNDELSPEYISGLAQLPQITLVLSSVEPL